ncbi:hypothetical protein FH972_024779 [Carpinus fangiana]|uniref:Uncharacterized protein n=1 Tax=Carpinus fangiana TaxID=176857 RepID=A0A5N6KZD3_9ROSI|nr:hypothetical protein FH972_024779 [Carpinus fangiana]
MIVKMGLDQMGHDESPFPSGTCGRTGEALEMNICFSYLSLQPSLKMMNVRRLGLWVQLGGKQIGEEEKSPWRLTLGRLSTQEKIHFYEWV